MAHLLEMIKRNGAAHAGKEEDAPEESDKVPEQKLREEDLVSTMRNFCSLSTLLLSVFAQILEMMLNRYFILFIDILSSGKVF